MSERSDEALLNPEQVAQMLNVSPSSVYKMKERGLLEAVELGIEAVRFRREDVMALINKRPRRKAA